MRRLRLLTVLAALGGLAALVANPVAAGWSDSGSLDYQVTASADFGGAPDDPGDEGEGNGFVWVCKLVGPSGNLRLQSEDPIRVSVNALDENGEFPDDQPSYLVEEGEKCTWPRQSETESTSTTEPPTDEKKRSGQPEETTPPESPDTTTSSTTTSSTTTTSTSTTSTTVAPTTTSTTSSTTTTTVPTSTTAPTIPEEPPGDVTP